MKQGRIRIVKKGGINRVKSTGLYPEESRTQAFYEYFSLATEWKFHGLA